MKDRNVQYPYRFHVRPVAGTDDICEIIPAPGTVYEDGTFWNKQNVLKDATAALYGKTAAAVPDEIFAAIRPLIQAAQSTADGKSRIVSGTFTGTGTYGINKPCSLTFPFAPKMVAVLFGPSPGGGGGRIYIGYSDTYPVISMDALTTEFQLRAGLTGYAYRKSLSYGRKSADGKTLYWYNTSDDTAQMNEQGATYYYVAIG